MVSPSPRSWLQAIQVYRRPRVLGMLFLGFAAGLPFPLVFTTLSTWLRDVGVDRTTIGFFAWVGITYSIKVFWSPVVDRAPLPGLTRGLGQRRGWMLLAQAVIVAGLIGMATTDPTQNIVAMALFALLVAFASATQDVAIDAYRIEAEAPEFQGAMAAMYQSGWRIAAALVGGAGALYLAEWVTWTASYIVMAISMGIGIVTVLIIAEPARAIARRTVMSEQRVIDFLEGAAHLPAALRVPAAWFIGAVVCPFTDFFQRNGRWALIILLFIAVYRISDIVLANMAYPFYIDLGFSKIEIANISKLYGFAMTIVGAMVGGVLVVRYGVMRILLMGAILVVLTNLLYAQLALIGKSLVGLTLVISADNFAAGLAGSAFIAYLSRLTNSAYTATQYALFSSLMTLVPKFVSGFSGMIVDGYGYVHFFLYASTMGIPSVLLVLYLMRKLDLDADPAATRLR
ncbi:MAG TPA: MFS transporter [Acidiferrobacterales bacterium]|jgi:PAT family beta-lactamase induction signal transducer AmpG